MRDSSGMIANRLKFAVILIVDNWLAINVTGGPQFRVVLSNDISGLQDQNEVHVS